jgi:Ion channel
MQMREVAILTPVIVGIGATACTIGVHALAVGSTVHLVRHERRLGHPGSGFWIDFAITVAVVLFALAAHLVEIAVWAAVFLCCGEFQHLDTALYQSAINYTTLGSSDVIMSPAWRMLGPLEAANGMLMFGVSTAIVFTVLQGVVQARYPDLRA